MKLITTTLLAAGGMLLNFSLAFAQATSAPAPSLQTAPTPSKASAYPVAPAPGLYQALGEQVGIQVLMDDFVRRLMSEVRFGDRFTGTKPDLLSKRLTEQVCVLSGGPCVYKGASMKDSHADMGITRAEFNLLVEVLQQAMDARDIPFVRQNQLLAVLAPMHRDVVGQ
ncbi:group I truncated hemoglobin [Rubrivivax sp. RP6-9]|uniref:group I truncated hemoglobin n=1 Tax=Rubrivivax sp. RP6-9 TaxID=3415750 RepID=UPI003CC5B5DC